MPFVLRPHGPIQTALKDGSCGKGTHSKMGAGGDSFLLELAGGLWMRAASTRLWPWIRPNVEILTRLRPQIELAS